jgi:hypothetical protein
LCREKEGAMEKRREGTYCRRGGRGEEEEEVEEE